MPSNEQQKPSRFHHLDPEKAADLLRRRLMTIGGGVGTLMGIAWVLLTAAIFPGFPPFGTPPFYILLFLAVIILGGSGLLVGRYFYTKIMAGKG